MINHHGYKIRVLSLQGSNTIVGLLQYFMATAVQGKMSPLNERALGSYFGYNKQPKLTSMFNSIPPLTLFMHLNLKN